MSKSGAFASYAPAAPFGATGPRRRDRRLIFQAEEPPLDSADWRAPAGYGNRRRCRRPRRRSPVEEGEPLNESSVAPATSDAQRQRPEQRLRVAPYAHQRDPSEPSSLVRATERCYSAVRSPSGRADPDESSVSPAEQEGKGGRGPRAFAELSWNAACQGRMRPRWRGVRATRTLRLWERGRSRRVLLHPSNEGTALGRALAVLQ